MQSEESIGRSAINQKKCNNREKCNQSGEVQCNKKNQKGEVQLIGRNATGRYSIKQSNRTKLINKSSLSRIIPILQTITKPLQ
jgi:hypothetical protein